jgi:hypothetical protein
MMAAHARKATNLLLAVNVLEASQKMKTPVNVNVSVSSG